MVSLIQHFEADFLWKVSLKILNSGIILKTFTYVFVDFVMYLLKYMYEQLRKNKSTYPPLSLLFSPNWEHILTDIQRDDTTVTIALRARPHLDFTISIFSGKKQHTICPD